MKFVVLGRYTEQGLSGFVKNPSDNRQEAAKKITEAAGAKLIEMMTLRGAYDFIAIVEEIRNRFIVIIPILSH